MKRHIVRASKVLIPLVLFIYLLELILGRIGNFWGWVLLDQFALFTDGGYTWILHLLASIFLTIILLVSVGRVLETNWVKWALRISAARIPLLRYLWSEQESPQRLTPVLFQHPLEKSWKLGALMGEQEVDDGRVFYKIFYVTGIGDHQLIEKDGNLVIPLENSMPEIMQLIASFMTSGPKVLKIKRNNEGQRT